MKKLLATLLIALLLPAAAFAEADALPAFAWERNGESHWQLDETGTAIHPEAHTISEETLRCTVCGCELLDWGDGCIDVTDYDEFGNLLRCTSFENNEKTLEIIHLLTYHESGAVLKDLEYIDGVLYGETIYTVTADGEQLPVIQTVWNDDGTTSVNDYDEHGNCIRAAVYAEDGAITFETISEFALNDDGWYYECKTTSRFDSGDTFYSETNQYGDVIRTLNTDANGVVWADHVYEYGYEDYIKLWSRQYTGGTLVWEETFDANGSLVQETEYREDGIRVVCLYDGEGELISETAYAEDGSILPGESF